MSENDSTALISISENVPKDYEDNVIADGGFGTVYTKEHPEYGNIVVKRVRLRHASDEVRSRSENDVEREHKMLHMCDHPNILKCFETRTLSTGSIELMLEQAGGGNLQDLVLKNEELAWDDRFHIAMGLAKGLSYLHSMSVVHGDIKPQNVLLTESKEVKIGDFGAARILEIPSASWESINRKQKDQKTNFYCAPELYKTHKNEDGTKAKIIKDFPMDVYSYAMVLYEVITKKEIYKDADRPPLIIQNAILRGERPNPAPLHEVMNSLQPESKDFEIFQLLSNIMKQCWDADPLKRLTMQKVETSLADFWAKKQAEERLRHEMVEAAKRQEEETARRKKEAEMARKQQEEKAARREEEADKRRAEDEAKARLLEEVSHKRVRRESDEPELRTVSRTELWSFRPVRQPNPPVSTSRNWSPYSVTSFSNDGSGSDDYFGSQPERRKLQNLPKRRSKRGAKWLARGSNSSNCCKTSCRVFLWIILTTLCISSGAYCYLGTLRGPMCSLSAVSLIFLFWDLFGPFFVWIFCCCSGPLLTKIGIRSQD
uniref:Influenza virus NS1A-binding protein-like n=1 Tax=Phallusia mammillata TaxID=59560 RepID=A0A6F9DFZ1_9ASCI|nr:influenza virus NS1A-binding protein-like [Phallusia mammillata]